MKLYSTNGQAPLASFSQATLSGLAPDGGLYLPTSWPKLNAADLSGLERLDFADLGAVILDKLLGDEIAREKILEICRNAFNFPVPLTSLSANTYQLELFHGPTLAFKDFGARFMAQLLSVLRQQERRELTILVATSGDTGGAVASGFFGAPHIRVVLLFGAGQVAPLQELQLTTYGGNITALEVAGTFDDCQRLVKEAFRDQELRSKLDLSSANSINVARLFPQTLYYFYAWLKLASEIGFEQAQQVRFSVPSGNFGNLAAGLMARRMGLPIRHFIGAVNANRTVPDYFSSGQYTPRPSVKTLSNAMDVGDPSNWARVLALYSDKLDGLRADLSSYSFSDQQTLAELARVYTEHGKLIDPHTAVGLLGLRRYRDLNDPACPGIVLATAHPGKFKETLDRVAPGCLELPQSLSALQEKRKHSLQINNSYSQLKDILLATL